MKVGAKKKTIAVTNTVPQEPPMVVEDKPKRRKKKTDDVTIQQDESTISEDTTMSTETLETQPVTENPVSETPQEPEVNDTAEDTDDSLDASVERRHHKKNRIRSTKTYDEIMQEAEERKEHEKEEHDKEMNKIFLGDKSNYLYLIIHPSAMTMDADIIDFATMNSEGEFFYAQNLDFDIRTLAPDILNSVVRNLPYIETINKEDDPNQVFYDTKKVNILSFIGWLSPFIEAEKPIQLVTFGDMFSAYAFFNMLNNGKTIMPPPAFNPIVTDMLQIVTDFVVIKKGRNTIFKDLETEPENFLPERYAMSTYISLAKQYAKPRETLEYPILKQLDTMRQIHQMIMDKDYMLS